MKKLITFGDVETTGLLESCGNSLDNQPKITEVCLIQVDKNFKVVNKFSSLINPGVEIPLFITRLTGITNEMAMDAPLFQEVYKKIKNTLKASYRFVAHNLEFDKTMLEIEAKRINKQLTFPDDLFCTVEQSMYIKGIRLKANELHKIVTGKDIIGIHRAENDVLAMIKNYKFLIKSKLPKHLI